jgi:hypothetical protein
MPCCPACTASVPSDSTDCKSCGAPFLKPSHGFFESRLTASQEAAIPIHKSAIVLLGLLGVGGAAWGLMAIAAGSTQVKWGFSIALALGLMVLLFFFSGFCGVSTLQGRYGWVRLNEILWTAQIPFFVSPFISYSFASGGFVNPWLQISPSVRVGFDAFLGSRQAIDFFTPGPLVAGVNLVAVAIWYYLRRSQRHAQSPA